MTSSKTPRICDNIFSFLTLILLLLSLPALQAQEILTGLTGNVQIRHQHERSIRKEAPTAPDVAVKLPFLDDFSNYTGYPKPELWSDRQGFVNTSYALYPPTLGCVTLDALDESGNVYAHASAEPFAADTLTSRRIRLDSVFTKTPRPLTLSDAIYFSFYYQPGGGAYIHNGKFLEWERVGDQPEYDDQLILEFGYETGDTVFLNDFVYGDYVTETIHQAGDTIFNPFIDGDFIIVETFTDSGTIVKMPMDSIFGPEEIWNKVWSSHGCSLDTWLKEDSLQYFKEVLIPINDKQYLRDNFQFRFRNFASLEENGLVGWASNVDQWNIDYVYLNFNRTDQDTCPDDVAFVMPPKSLLKDYQSMPWNQFRQNELATEFDNTLSNLYNDEDGVNVKYTYFVTQEGTVVKNYISNNFNAYPYYHHGFHTYAPHAAPAIDFQLPTNADDSACFTITHIFSKAGLNDLCTANDTAVFEQKFYNYFAYDDGIAENGYSILSTNVNPEAALAMRFKLNEPDTLRAVRMWFNHVLNNANKEPFTLMVWNDKSGKPGDILYEQSAQLPEYEEDFLNFYTYFLDEPISVSGTFYVGFYQNHNVQLNIGFDCNNDSRKNFFVKTTNNWKEPYYKGTPMIRPVLGKPIQKGEEEDAIQDNQNTHYQCVIYPNPTNGTLTVTVGEGIGETQIQVFDLTGRHISDKRFYGNSGEINLTDYQSGIYILKICTDNHLQEIKKVIKN